MPPSATGHIMLQGGHEFNGRMADADRRALALCGALTGPVVIVPTAAAPDNNHERAGATGVAWYASLGPRPVTAVPLIDRPSAGDPALADTLRNAALIYLLGGFPGYLADTLADSAAWAAMQAAYRNGSILAGSSAGAMVLCERYFDPQQGRIRKGLGMLPGCAVLPHHDTYGGRWAQQFKAQLSGATLIGLDEETGIIGRGPGSRWTVHGKGAATLYSGDRLERHQEGAAFTLL